MERVTILWIAICLLLSVVFSVEAGERFAPGRVIDDVFSDHAHFYSTPGLRHLTLGLVGAWVLANTRADEGIQDWYREKVRTRTTDDVSKWVKPLGNGRIAVPALVGVAIMGKLGESVPGGATIHRWSGRSLRALLLGAPPVLILQVAVGSSRPGESDSRWRPFQDDNGVSGHAFVGAVPFLSAARMTQSRILKPLCYAGSTLCGLSRINDDAHYFSQAAMGWWVAYLSCAGVEKTETEKGRLQLLPVMPPSGEAAAVAVRVTF